MNKVKPPGGYPRTTGKKWCRVCDKKKEAEEFNSDRNSWDGLQPKCKTCSSKLNKSAYQEKAEVLKARRRERYRLQKEAKLRSTNPHKAGDKSKAICQKCEGVMPTTARGEGAELAFYCDNCDDKLSIPQSAFGPHQDKE